MQENKEDIIWFFNNQIQQVRSVKSPAAKMAAQEMDLLVERYKEGHISMEELVQRYDKVAYDFSAMFSKGWRR